MCPPNITVYSHHQQRAQTTWLLFCREEMSGEQKGLLITILEGELKLSQWIQYKSKGRLQCEMKI